LTLVNRNRLTRGFVNVRLEQVVLFKPDQIFHAGFPGVLFGLGNTYGVDVDANAVGPIQLGGRNHDPAVATAEVVENVTGSTRTLHPIAVPMSSVPRAA